MADVQLEKGYFRVANQAADALMRANLTAREFRVALAVLRLTWGWRKKNGLFAMKDLEKLTGIRRQNCYDALRALVAKSMVLVVDPPRGNHPGTYCFNKDFDAWDLSLLPPRGCDKSRIDVDSTVVIHGDSTVVIHGDSTNVPKNGYPEPFLASLKTRENKGNNSGVLDKLLNEVLRLVRTAGWTIIPPDPWLMGVRTRLRPALAAKSPERIIECAKDAIERTNEQANGPKLAYFLPVFDGLLAEQEPQAPNYIAPDPEFEYPSSWQQRDEVA